MNNYCSNCGNKLAEYTIKCPKCGIDIINNNTNNIDNNIINNNTNNIDNNIVNDSIEEKEKKDEFKKKEINYVIKNISLNLLSLFLIYSKLPENLAFLHELGLLLLFISILYLLYSVKKMKESKILKALLYIEITVSFFGIIISILLLSFCLAIL